LAGNDKDLGPGFHRSATDILNRDPGGKVLRPSFPSRIEQASFESVVRIIIDTAQQAMFKPAARCAVVRRPDLEEKS
jgi:hypothetical protein